MTITYVPPGHRAVRILKPTMYAHELLPAGMRAVLPNDEATRLVKEKRAELLAEDARPMVNTSCPRCFAAMNYVQGPREDERWTSCGACGFGWTRS